MRCRQSKMGGADLAAQRLHLMREPAPRGDDALTRLASWMTRPVPASIIIKPCRHTRRATKRCNDGCGGAAHSLLLDLCRHSQCMCMQMARDAQRLRTVPIAGVASMVPRGVLQASTDAPKFADEHRYCGCAPSRRGRRPGFRRRQSAAPGCGRRPRMPRVDGQQLRSRPPRPAPPCSTVSIGRIKRRLILSKH